VHDATKTLTRTQNMKYSTQRDKRVQRVILIEGSANLLDLILKTIVGLSTGSMAKLADAIHSLTDLTNNVIAWFVIDVYRIRSRWIGKACAIDLVISVDPTLSTEESHDIADKIESIIEKRFDASDISIHVEPETNQ